MLMDVEGRAAPAAALTVNGRSYAWPRRPTVVICFDGCDLTYIAAARAAGAVPALERMIAEGFFATALAAMPTFTNPNNVSIVCGVPASVHGVGGNYYLDRETGATVMMVDAAPMRCDTILGRFSEAGARVVGITAKDKLKKAIARGLDGIAFSAEKAADATEAENGIADVVGLVGRPAPDQYSADLSLFVLDAGIRLLEQGRRDLVYLSLSDYVQHKHAPEAPEAIAFMRAVDARLERLLDLGAVVGIVADHGMTDMAAPDGRPNVVYVGDQIDAAFGEGAARVICPITDPFVRHHGALGGFVRVHLRGERPSAEAVAAFLRGLPGVELALTREAAAARFETPLEQEGDVAVVGRRGVALGARAVDHDAGQLAGARLRSHGSLAEQPVPFIVSHRLREGYPGRAAPLRNFDIFDAVLNAVEA